MGKAGQLLDPSSPRAGLDRADVAVANVLKCRPPANRAPRRAEVGRCVGWLDQQLPLLDPPRRGDARGHRAAWALGTGIRLRDARGAAARLARAGGWSRPTTRRRPSGSGPGGEPLAALRADLALAREVLCAR